MKIYSNPSSNTTASLSYLVDPAHYEPEHDCQGDCKANTIQVEPGARVTFDGAADNWGDIETVIAATTLEAD